MHQRQGYRHTEQCNGTLPPLLHALNLVLIEQEKPGYITIRECDLNDALRNDERV